MHLDDVAEAFARLIEKRKQLPEDVTLLIGEPDTLSYDEVQRMTGQRLHGEEWETREIPKTLARTGAWLENEVLDEEPFIKPWMVDFADDHYALDVGLADRLIGWKPAHSLRAELPGILERLKSDPQAWYRANKLEPAMIAANPTKEDEGKRQEIHASGAEGEGMLLTEHRKTLWTHFVNILLGVWLITSPGVLGLFDATAFSEAVLRVTQERGLPPPDWRNWAMGWSDIASGVLIVLFGALSLSRRTNWAQWANTVVGIWLLLAPLVFWAASAAAYMNDTIIGALVITFAVLVPMMPGMAMEGMMDKRAIPPGWDYCPSTWAQRLPIIICGAIGFFIARYLAAYQMGHIEGIWEPFFGGLEAAKNGTESIITSSVSMAWPVPDAGLGVVDVDEIDRLNICHAGITRDANCARRPRGRAAACPGG